MCFVIYCHGAAFYMCLDICGSRQGLCPCHLRVSLGDAARTWGTPMSAWFHQGCPFAPVLFLVFMYRVIRCSQGVCPIWEPQDYISAFRHDVTFIFSSVDELQHALERFALPENHGLLAVGGWGRGSRKWFGHLAPPLREVSGMSIWAKG